MIDFSILPLHCRDILKDYVMHGKPVHDDFLEAVLQNNLIDAFKLADALNADRVGDYAKFLYHAPIACYGSKSNYDKWIRAGGLNGHTKNMKNVRDRPNA